MSANASLCGYAHWPTIQTAQTDFISARWKGKAGRKLTLTSSFPPNIWRSLLGARAAGKGGREVGRENTPALIVCVLARGLHDRQGFSLPGHYSIKEGPELEHRPQRCCYKRSQETNLNSVHNACRGRLGSSWSLAPSRTRSVPVPHYHLHFIGHLPQRMLGTGTHCCWTVIYSCFPLMSHR